MVLGSGDLVEWWRMAELATMAEEGGLGGRAFWRLGWRGGILDHGSVAASGRACFGPGRLMRAGLARGWQS